MSLFEVIILVILVLSAGVVLAMSSLHTAELQRLSALLAGQSDRLRNIEDALDGTEDEDLKDPSAPLIATQQDMIRELHDRIMALTDPISMRELRRGPAPAAAGQGPGSPGSSFKAAQAHLDSLLQEREKIARVNFPGIEPDLRPPEPSSPRPVYDPRDPRRKGARGTSASSASSAFSAASTASAPSTPSSSSAPSASS